MATRNGKTRGKKSRMPSVGYVPCRVEPGMFRGEYLVSFDAIDPQRPEKSVIVRLLADENEVVIRSDKSPKRDVPVEGLLRVEVVGKEKGFALVVLPQPAQPVGERAYVDERRVQEEVGV